MCVYILYIMSSHSSTFAWKIPWAEEPGRLQSMRSLRVRHDFIFTFTFHFHALEEEMATHSCSCLENPRDHGAWWAAVYGVPQSWTRLKRLSSSSSKITEDGDYSHEIKRRLLLGRTVMTKPDSVLKSRDVTLPTMVPIIKAIVFPVVRYGCGS